MLFYIMQIMRKSTTSSDPLDYVCQEFMKTLTSDFKRLTLVLHNPKSETNYFLEFDTAHAPITQHQREQLSRLKMTIWRLRSQITCLRFVTTDLVCCNFSTISDYTFSDFSDYYKLNK